MLSRLQFISRELIAKNGAKLRALLKQESLNLLVGPDGGVVVDPELSVIDEKTGKEVPYKVPTEDITKNLFKICCAIMNIRPKQRMFNTLDEIVLKEHLDPLTELHKGVGPIMGAAGNPDAHLVEQLHILKSLVQRRAFSLTDRQIATINSKFTNFSFTRKLRLYNEAKDQKIRQHREETTPEFSPEICANSRRMDQYVSHARRVPGSAKSPDSKAVRVTPSPRNVKKKVATYAYAQDRGTELYNEAQRQKARKAKAIRDA